MGVVILNKQPEFAATFQFGKTKVHIIGPENVSDEEKQQILNEIQLIGWKIIQDRITKQMTENDEQK